MIKRARIGHCEFIPFQDANGKIERRLMYPLLDEFGGVIRWVEIEQGYIAGQSLVGPFVPQS